MTVARRERGERPQVSVVAPCFNEEDGLEEFHRRASEACRRVAGDDYEIVLVDDGSRDRTWGIIERLSERDAGVVGVRLARNHGHQLAVTAGLGHATGDRVLLIDADLQDPPELLADMMIVMDQNADVDVVYGKRIKRDGETLFKKLSSAAFYRLLGKLTDVPIHNDTGEFRLMSRRVVDTFLAMPEAHRYIGGMVSWIGLRQVALPFERKARYAGQTKFPLSKMLHVAADAVTSFSTVPLKLAVWLGMAVAAAAGGLLIFSIWEWLAGHTVTGWTSLITAVALFAGVQLTVLGIIGVYLGRLVQQSKQRPLYLVDAIASNGRSQRQRLIGTAGATERRRAAFADFGSNVVPIDGRGSVKE